MARMSKKQTGGKPTSKHGIELAPDRDPWDRQPGETAKAFRAFEVYLHLHPHERAVSKAAKIIGCSRTNLNQWCAPNRWVDRALAFDDMLAKKRVHEKMKTVEEMAKRHAKVGQLAQAVGVKELEKHLEKIKRLSRLRAEEGRPDEPVYSVKEALALVEKGSILERSAVGAPTQITENRNVDMPKSHDDVIAEARALIKAKREQKPKKDQK